MIGQQAAAGAYYKSNTFDYHLASLLAAGVDLYVVYLIIECHCQLSSSVFSMLVLQVFIWVLFGVNILSAPVEKNKVGQILLLLLIFYGQICRKGLMHASDHSVTLKRDNFIYE